RNFLISIVSIVSNIERSRIICSSFSERRSIPRLAFSTPLIVIMLMDNIPMSEEISPNNPGRSIVIAYSRYHSVFAITLPFAGDIIYRVQSKVYKYSFSIIPNFNLNEKMHIHFKQNHVKQ